MHERNLYVNCYLDYYYYMWKKRLIYRIMMCLVICCKCIYNF
jgi:hypothetical protein